MSSSMLGWWDGVWDVPHNPPDDTTYRLAAAWLDEVCEDVEDWGCGGSFAKQFFKAKYKGVDGSRSKAHVIADLRSYTSFVDGILLRHVLEHNRDWRLVLFNAMLSAQKRLAIVLFTPFSEVTHELSQSPKGIPDISFSRDDLKNALEKSAMVLVSWTGYKVRETSHETQTQYGAETILYVEKG